MSKTRRSPVELRYYELPRGEWVLPLLGDSWKRRYGGTGSRHFHNLTEIGLCRTGGGTLTDGAARVPYGPGTFTLFPANVPHDTESARPDRPDFWEYLFVDADALLQAHFGADTLAAEAALEQLHAAPHVFAAREQPALCAAVCALMTELRTASPAGELVKTLAAALLLRFAAAAENAPAARPAAGAGELRLRPALLYVRGHAAEPMRVEALAASCGLSETHFRRVFFETMNMTPLDYIALERVRRACALLQNSALSMEQVAEKTGFASQTTFDRTFRRLVGTTPSRWKQICRAGRADSLHWQITARAGWR